MPEPVRRTLQPTRSGGPAVDIGMSLADWHALRDAIAGVFDHETSASNILDRIGFPRQRRPAWSGNSEETWNQIFTTLEHGIIASPQRWLLHAAAVVYPYNPVFQELSERYGLITDDRPADDDQALVDAPTEGSGSDNAPQSAPGGRRESATGAAAPGPVAAAPPTCHVIVRAASEQERAAAAQILRDLGLEPQDVWATAHATSFRVSSDTAAAVRELLDPTGMSWVVVPPGSNDYLIRELYVSGPDGRRFRLIDAPAQQTVADVAAGIVDQYGPSFADKARPTVMDRVLPGGQGERLSPDSTLHDAGVRDGASLRLGFEATAGAVNPMDHQDALHRMRNQILNYARSRPDMTVSGAPPTLPTHYEITFVQPSFGPPGQEGGNPTRITEHRVQVQFRADFPETPPLVFWDSPIFHPNIYPLYDSEQARRAPARQGLVCLGALAESYTPALSFADLCQTLIDMAAYRNYSVLEPTGEVGADGSEELARNYYDRTAATWAWNHQAEIIAMGGSPAIRRSRIKKAYQNAIETVG